MSNGKYDAVQALKIYLLGEFDDFHTGIKIRSNSERVFLEVILFRAKSIP